MAGEDTCITDLPKKNFKEDNSSYLKSWPIKHVYGYWAFIKHEEKTQDRNIYESLHNNLDTRLTGWFKS